jgi:hypothetical protein
VGWRPVAADSDWYDQKITLADNTIVGFATAILDQRQAAWRARGSMAWVLSHFANGFLEGLFEADL